MNPQPIIRSIGRRCHAEHYSEAKLRDSLEQACYSVGSPDGAVSDIVSRVLQSVADWLSEKPEVTSDDLRRKASEKLEQFCPEAGYLYKHQKSII